MKCSNIQELPVIKGVESECVPSTRSFEVEVEKYDRVALRSPALT
jgi:hypothetical protein